MTELTWTGKHIDCKKVTPIRITFQTRLIETEAWEYVDVRLRDNTTINWCAAASSLTNDQWIYLKVPQKDFEKLHPETFEELIGGIGS